jgi:hypothetical protein
MAKIHGVLTSHPVLTDLAIEYPSIPRNPDFERQSLGVSVSIDLPREDWDALIDDVMVHDPRSPSILWAKEGRRAGMTWGALGRAFADFGVNLSRLAVSAKQASEALRRMAIEARRAKAARERARRLRRYRQSHRRRK